MNGSAPAPAAAALFRTAVTIALGTIAAAALILRITSIEQPLGIDQSLWASAVYGMSRGQLLYQDVWEQRPPGIYWIYLAGFRWLGWTTSTVAWLDILAAAATTLLLYLLARTLAGARAGALAAALYAALTMPAWLYSHSGFLERSVCETFITVCIALSCWSAVQFRERGSPPFAFSLGLFAGAAVVLKPNAGLYFPAVLLWIAFYSSGSWKDKPETLVRPVLLAMLGATVLPLIAVVWLWHLGVLRESTVAVIDFNRHYVTQGFTLDTYPIKFAKAVWLRIKTDPLWLSGSIGAAAAMWELARTGRLPAQAGLAVLWGGASALVIIANGAWLFNSYFIQALAPLALLSAWLLTGFSGGARSRRMVSVSAAVLILVLLVQRGYVARVSQWTLADWNLIRGRMSRTEYLHRFGGYDNGRGYSARANEELAEYVRARTDPADRIFLFGINGAGVYFLAERLTAHRFLRVNFFVMTDFPDPRFRLEAVLDDLERARPRYLIFERLNSASEMGKTADALPQHPAVIRLLGAYVLETRLEDFAVYRRVE